MSTKSNAHIRHLALWVYTLVVGLTAPSFAQSTKFVQSHPAQLPYSFSNFVWWSNDDLRTLLKQRIPNLGDEIAPTRAVEGKVRDTLTELLKEKGIAAEVQSQDPSAFSLAAERAPAAPAPSVVFSILSPEILIDKVVVSQAPNDLDSLGESLRAKEGTEYSGGQDWFVRSNIREELTSKGYLEADVDIDHDMPRKDGDHYLVNLLVSVKAGPQYRIAAISADGGPLLRDKDLSSFFAQRPGDVAGIGPFGRLAGQIRAFYWHFGYADVDIQGPPALDHEHALVSYHLQVAPGPLYHVRSLTIHNLNSEQESIARQMLGLKPGDVFDQIAIDDFSRRITANPSISAYSFTFTPIKDASNATVDLTLDFFNTSGKATVTVK